MTMQSHDPRQHETMLRERRLERLPLQHSSQRWALPSLQSGWPAPHKAQCQLAMALRRVHPVRESITFIAPVPTVLSSDADPRDAQPQELT